MTSTDQSAEENAIQLALEQPSLAEALSSIAEWEHDRALNHFLSTGKRETNFGSLITQVLRRHHHSEETPQ